MDGVALLTITVLAVFVGFEVVSKVSSTLHTPLMSGANAIHGIILVGAIIVAGQASDGWTLAIALLAVVLATANLVGGFVVTDRMLEMFRGRRAKPAASGAERPAPARCRRCEGGRSMTLLSPTWTAILYLVAAVCFILALKGLSSPKTARRGNLIGAAGAIIAVITVFLSSKLDNIPWILAAIAVGSAIAAPVARRVQMTQMPQLVALFNGVGGGAAALVALLELAHTDDPWVRVAIVFTLLVGAISFSGSLVTFAKLQELMTTRPVVFAGLPVIMGLVLLAAIGAAVAVVVTGAGVARGRAARARPRGRRAARAAGGRRRRADRDLAAQRVHRPRGRGVGPGARQRAARGRGHARRGIRNHPHPGHGVGDGPQRHGHPVRRVPRRVDGRARPRHPTGPCGRRAPRTSRCCSATRRRS